MEKYRDQLANQVVKMDFGNEVPYAFGYLPENAKLNAEIFKRAIDRAKSSPLGQIEKGPPPR